MEVKIPVEQMTPPDSSKLVERMLKPFSVVELVPFSLIDNGYKALLMPARGGKVVDGDDKRFVDIDPHTLPILDLKAAGIETDRRPQTILAEAAKLFKERRFIMRPTYVFPWSVALGQVVGLLYQTKVSLVSMQASRWFLHPADFNPRQEVDEFLNQFPRTGFTLKLEGDPIPGLDVSRPVEGFVWRVNEFLLPNASVDKSTPDYKAFEATVSFYLRRFGLEKVELEFKEYIDTNEKKWWFKYSRKMKRFWREKRICMEEVNQALARANERLAALPA